MEFHIQQKSQCVCKKTFHGIVIVQLNCASDLTPRLTKAAQCHSLYVNYLIIYKCCDLTFPFCQKLSRLSQKDKAITLSLIQSFLQRMSLSLSYRKKLEMQMKFYHKSNLFSCQILSRALTYCKSFDVRRMPINPKEIAEKYEKSNMQILAVNKEIRKNNKTNGIGGSSIRCIRHVSVDWQVAR